MSRLPECDPNVYAYGDIVAVLDVPKEEAEKYCQDQTLITGRKHDWHYAGGRVVVKALTFTPLPKLQGVGRGQLSYIALYFAEPLTDDQLRHLNEHINKITEK